MVNKAYILIEIAKQELRLYQSQKCIKTYPVSTGKNGTGNQNGSEKTPLGKHQIKLKIGGQCPVNAVFVARRFTGEIFTPEMMRDEPERDWILSRILWLAGLEPGYNLGANTDTQKRLIYIHGTPNNEPIGVPYSHGCIRMRNNDIIELYDLIQNHTPVDIIKGTM